MLRPIKPYVQRWLFRSGKARRILVGPCRGLRYRPSEITGLSPLYSGAERYLQKALCDHLRPGDVAIDAGANWGIHALLMGRLVGSTGAVFAFEPYPPAFAALLDHVQLNGQTQLNCVQAALGKNVGLVAFQLGLSYTTGRVVAECPEGSREAIQVPATTIDAFIIDKQLDRLRLMKVDVEGGEHDVLAGAAVAIEQHRPVLIVELHNPDQDVAVSRWLRQHDYRIERLSAGPPIVHFDCGWPEPGGVWGTLLARPRIPAERRCS